MATEAQIKANRENSKKSPHLGKPISSATLEGQLQRKLLQEYLREHLDEMYDAQIVKAKEGDTQSFIALLDRSWGKPAQAITGADGTDLFPTTQEKEKANEVLYAFLDK